jgi:predicted HNH restriction endonuclease
METVDGVIKITLTRPDVPTAQVEAAIKYGIDAATSEAVSIQQENAPVKTGNLKRSIYGDFTQIDSFKASVIQDGKIAPYGPITDSGYNGTIKPKTAKILKLHISNGTILYRKSVQGQKAQNWWVKINNQLERLQAAFLNGFRRV